MNLVNRVVPIVGGAVAGGVIALVVASGSTTTHSVTKRPLGIYMSNGGKPKQVASFGIGGTDFELMK